MHIKGQKYIIVVMGRGLTFPILVLARGISNYQKGWSDTLFHGGYEPFHQIISRIQRSGNPMKREKEYY